MTLAALRLIPGARRNLDVREYEALTAARDDGATWREIAAALGLESPQAAAQRYQRLKTRCAPGGTFQSSLSWPSMVNGEEAGHP